MQPSTFITVEGGEGVGKSTFISSLVSSLEARGLKVRRTFEPGGTEVANRIRELFVNPPAGEALTIQAEFCLVSAARAQHVHGVIRPSLARGEWIVCDRFSDSSRIYQGVLGGIDAVTIEDIIQFSTKGLKPDLTFLLDCDARVSMQRLALRAQASTAASRFDRQSQEYHERIRQGFLQLAEREPQRFCLVDASLSAQAMIEYAMAELRKRFGGSV